jgi:ADP-ribosylglycohydrolase
MAFMTSLERSLLCLEGLSIGDAFGQCFFQEDTRGSEIERVLPEAPWYYTDDTEMSLSIVSNLMRFGRIEQHALAMSFAERYSYDRAYGPSMHRALARIRDGEDWRAVAADGFGGQGSFGNGAAMRAAPSGAFFMDDLADVVEQAALSAEPTHMHPEGIAGAVAVALAAALAVRYRHSSRRPTHKEFINSIIDLLPASEVRSKLERAASISSASSRGFAVSILGNGVGMSAQDTVPYAIWCSSMCLDDFVEALWLAVDAGGDRDTLCAIVGSIVASYVGSEGIPDAWMRCREELPRWHLESQ